MTDNKTAAIDDSTRDPLACIEHEPVRHLALALLNIEGSLGAQAATAATAIYDLRRAAIELGKMGVGLAGRLDNIAASMAGIDASLDRIAASTERHDDERGQRRGNRPSK